MPTKSRKRSRSWVSVLLLSTVSACRSPLDGSPSASIELAPVVVIEGSGDSLDLLDYADVLRSSSGAWYVVYPIASARGHAALVDSTGRLVKIFLGTGRGPGEVEVFGGLPSTTGIGFGPGDSVIVGREAGARKSTLMRFSPPPALSLVRSDDRAVRFFVVTATGFLEPSFISSAALAKDFNPAPGAKLVGFPPRTYTSDGAMAGVYGPYVSDPDDRDVFGAVIPADSSRVWSATARRYEVSLVDPDARRVRTITRTVPWFPPDTGQRDFPWIKRPPTRIESLALDDSVLWVLISRASRNWDARRPRNPPAVRPGMPIQRMIPYARTDLFESVLEAFDTRSGRFLATQDLSGDYRRFNNGGQLIEVREDSIGVVRLALSRPRLRPRARQ